MLYAHRECPIHSEHQKYTTIEEKKTSLPSFLRTKRNKEMPKVTLLPALLQHYLASQCETDSEIKHSSSHAHSHKEKEPPISCIKHLALNKVIYILTCLYIVVCTCHPPLTLNAGHLLTVCHRYALRRNTFNGTDTPQSSHPSNKFTVQTCTTLPTNL